MSIPISYLRSSSIGNWGFCEHQFFLTYTLGLEYKVNHKAELGSVTHGVLEILAQIKKHFQTSSDSYYLNNKDMDLDYIVNLEDFIKEYKLSPLEVDKINSTRINKDVYKWNCFIEYDHVRHGVDLVEYLCVKLTDYYKKHSPNNWVPIDYKHVNNFTWLCLDFSNNTFDPRRRDIVDIETHFDITLPFDWAKYEYFIGDEHLTGQLSLKGTMDLTTKISDDTYEIIDWKTGQKLDWAKNKPKTYESLHDDHQLLLYYYVAKQLYPDKHILMSIFFIRDGGPYTLCFDDSKLEQGLKLFKDTYESIKNTKIPRLLDNRQKDFRCNRICDYYKQKVGKSNICQFIHKDIKTNGIDETIKNYTKEGHKISHYSAPGDV